MNYLRVTNWAKWQTYRNDRGTPPWIKIHRQLMSSATWAALEDHDKGHLVSIWIVAADRDGRVPADATVLRKICLIDRAPDLNKFIDLGFLEPDGCQGDASVTPTRRQSDAPETETETETEEKDQEQARQQKPQKRGFRLPTDWQPHEELRRWAMTERTDLDIQRVIDSFTDYWRARPGQSGCKLDWDATFRNWVRNEKRRIRERENAVQARERRNRDALLRGI